MSSEKIQKSKKLWLKGGIIGALICIILFFFYIFAYFPILERVYKDDIEKTGSTPMWTLAIPAATGHLFPFFSMFIVPYGFLCDFTEPICTTWSAIEEPGSTPWKLETGEAGYCVEQTLTPTDSCANVSDQVGFWGLATGLLAIYFAIGTAIGGIVQKRRNSR